MAKKFDPDSFPPNVKTREQKLEYALARMSECVYALRRAEEFAVKVLAGDL